MKSNSIYRFGEGDFVRFEDYEKLQTALEKIYNYPQEDSLWMDDRDDAAWDIVRIAGEALSLEDY